MHTFKQFLEATEDEIKAVEAEESPANKFKEAISDLVNHLLDQMEEKDSEKVLDYINRFKTELESLNEDAQNIIENKRLYLSYIKKYESLMGTLEAFEEPPTNIDPLLAELKQGLTGFYEFVQSQISS